MKRITAYFMVIAYTVSLIFPCYANETSVESVYNDVIYDDETLDGFYDLLEEKWNKIHSTNNDIQLFQTGFVSSTNKMPSTGNVKVLVLPMEFKDKKFYYSDYVDTMQNSYFTRLDNNALNRTVDRNLSLVDLYKRMSMNQLKLSGQVLPLYTTSKNKEDYFADGQEQSQELVEEIASALRSNRSIIGDISEYDANGDGYIDCLHVVSPGGPYNRAYAAGMGCRGYNTEIYDNVKIKGFAGIRDVGSHAHETGHLMGLPDNYTFIESSITTCPIPKGMHELMNKYREMYVNALYRYLLDWDEPIIVPFENGIQDIEIHASDIYKDNAEHETRSVIFCPNPDELPFGEYYIAEYRAYHDNGNYANQPGVVLWHCDVKKNGYYAPYGISSVNTYLKPVYKTGDETTDFLYDDFYREGDEWSDTTTPSSKFYNGTSTGAYMKVLSMDDDKATLRVGYNGIDEVTRPKITFTGTNKNYVKKYADDSDIAIFNYNVENSTKQNTSLGFEVITTGDVQYNLHGGSSGITGQRHYDITIKGGNGTIQLKAPKGLYMDDLGFKSPEALSPVIYVDNIAPTGEITYSTTETTDKPVTATLSTLSEDIQPTEMTYTFTNNGSYTFHFKDLAGNEGTATATVDWIEPKPMEIAVEYSTQKPTNQNVTVRAIPSKPVKESESELTHTFTDNGSYTFICTDENGIEHEKTVTVDWIDREAPNLGDDLHMGWSVSKQYVSARLNGPVVALQPPEWRDPTYYPDWKLDWKPFDRLHVFEENGTWTYDVEDFAGNKSTTTREVTWIEKDNPLGEIRYSTMNWTNQPVTVTLVTKYGEMKGVEQNFVVDNTSSQQAYVVDESGNKIYFYYKVHWIDKKPPTAVIEYSTTDTTEDSVTATVVKPSEFLKESEEELSYTFERNGTHTFTITDYAGNTTDLVANVDWIIDTKPPTAKVRYSTESLTNQDVVAELYDFSEDIEESGEALTHTFTQNGSYAFTITDTAGNIATIPVTVDWIDKVPPVGTVSYSTTAPTNQSVTATVSADKELTAESETEYTFTENGTHTFHITDLAGNTAEVIATVNNIDKIKPTAKVRYSTTSPTNQNVVAELYNISEDIEETGDTLKHTFTENGTHTFTITDKAGNQAEITTAVNNIDRKPPVGTVTYSTTAPTNQNVTATVSADKELTEGSETEYVFTDNGTHTFTITDKAGNTAEVTATVNNIDKIPPKGTVTYSTTAPTNQNVTATVTADKELTIDSERECTFTENGTHVFHITDLAGNTAEVTATVNNIDRTAPSAEVRYSTTLPTSQSVTATVVANESLAAESETEYIFTENGTHVFHISDLAGNTAEVTATVGNIDKSLPTAKIRYSTEIPTNKDVTVELYDISKEIQESVNTLKHTFTENGSYTFTITDLAGNASSIPVEVTWIDKTPPTGTVTYSTTVPTNQNVTATLNASEELTADSETEYVFTKNGTHTFTITDLAGNTAEITATVSNIDRTPPTAEMVYSTTSPTNQSVVAELSNISESIQEPDSELKYTFTKNGTHTFVITDLAGNTAEIVAEVNNIDKTPPTAKVRYSKSTLTNEDVVAELYDISETITETGSALRHTFTDNGSHTFSITDLAGNETEIPVTVDWIDKTAPTVRVKYSTKSLTNQDVAAELVDVSEEIQETGEELKHSFAKNGSYTFTITDLAGNETDIPVTVTWIDKTPPTATIKYTPSIDTYGTVTAEIFPSETIQETELRHTFTENGSYTFNFTDLAGNEGNATAEVTWILEPTPEPTDEPIPTDKPEPTDEPTPTQTPSDRIDFTRFGNNVIAKLVFEVTDPPQEQDIQLYVAYKKDGVLKRIEQPEITDMTAGFTIPKAFDDCDISLYVWDKDMLPLMNVQWLE